MAEQAGSGSSSAPPVFDPSKIDTSGSSGGSRRSSGGGGYSTTQSGVAQYKQYLVAKYIQLWGVDPPPGYIDRAAAAHMNIFEFEAHERAKPAFKSSQTYQEERINAEFSLAQQLGALG